MDKPFTAYALDEAAMEKYDVLFALRSDVNGALEAARNEKRIGKALEAHVTLARFRRFCQGSLAKVSGLNHGGAVLSLPPWRWRESAQGVQGTAYPGLTVAVEEARGTKCPRCWMHSTEANEDGLCPRCAAVMKTIEVEL